MARLGADVDQLSQLSRTFQTSATTLSSVVADIDGAVRATWWVGAHADDFTTGWTSRDRVKVQGVASTLEGLASDLTQQVEQQRQASDDSGGGGGFGGWLGDVVDTVQETVEDAVERFREVRGALTDLEDLPPGQRADYWQSLDPSMQAALLTLSPAALMQMQGLPASVRRRAEQKVAQEAADDVVTSSYEAFVDAEVDILSWEAEGRAEATYEVYGDGHVEMALRLEAGLGREIEVGGAEVEASAGGTTELRLQFDSAEEAQAFLDGLDDAAFDLGWTDLGNAPAHVATNVAEYVMEQDIKDARVGVYGQVEVEMDNSAVDFEASGRIEGYYDLADDQKGLIISGEADFGFGPDGEAASTSAAVRAEVIMDGQNEFEKLQMSAEFSADAAVETLGADIPGLKAGQDVQATFIVDANNPNRQEIMSALAAGDVNGAAALVGEHAEVHLQQQAVVSGSGDEHDLSIAGQGVEVEWGVEHSVSTVNFVRPAGGQGFHQLEN